jgi:hypothetical protein
MLKKTGLFLGATALALGGVFAAAGAASAETANSTASVSADKDVSTGSVVAPSIGIAAALPSCASYGHSGQFAWVDNYCSYTIHAKIIWAFAPDTACYTLAPGESLESSRGGLARFDGAVSC